MDSARHAARVLAQCRRIAECCEVAAQHAERKVETKDDITIENREEPLTALISRAALEYDLDNLVAAHELISKCKGDVEPACLFRAVEELQQKILARIKSRVISTHDADFLRRGVAVLADVDSVVEERMLHLASLAGSIEEACDSIRCVAHLLCTSNIQSKVLNGAAVEKLEALVMEQLMSSEDVDRLLDVVLTSGGTSWRDLLIGFALGFR